MTDIMLSCILLILLIDNKVQRRAGSFRFRSPSLGVLGFTIRLCGTLHSSRGLYESLAISGMVLDVFDIKLVNHSGNAVTFGNFWARSHAIIRSGAFGFHHIVNLQPLGFCLLVNCKSPTKTIHSLRAKPRLAQWPSELLD